MQLGGAAGAAVRSGARRRRRYRLGAAERDARPLSQDRGVRAAVRAVAPRAGQLQGDRGFRREPICKTNSARFIPICFSCRTAASCTPTVPIRSSRTSRDCGWTCEPRFAGEAVQALGARAVTDAERAGAAGDHRTRGRWLRRSRGTWCRRCKLTICSRRTPILPIIAEHDDIRAGDEQGGLRAAAARI